MAVQISEYRTVKETAEAWGVTKRWVNMCIKNGRVPSAVRMGSQWLVPGDMAKPGKARQTAEQQETATNLALTLQDVIDKTTGPWPADAPDTILDTVGEERLRLQFAGELAFLRGDFSRVVQYFRAIGDDDAAKLRACPLIIATAVSTGDYLLFTEVETYLNGVAIKYSDNWHIVAFTELCLATASTGAIAPNIAPDWLKSGDFSGLPLKARPDATYKRAKYFQSLGNFEFMLGVAQTALSFCSHEGGITFHDIYFRVACAIACVHLRREDEANRWLSDALALALPHGFITPFAESATAFDGLLEQLLEREYPTYLAPITAQWQNTFANWIAFHNHFTRHHITSMLTLREYEMASMVVRRIPRAQIAAQFHISSGRLNNIMKEIYGKLFVSGREELSQYIL